MCPNNEYNTNAVWNEHMHWDNSYLAGEYTYALHEVLQLLMTAGASMQHRNNLKKSVLDYAEMVNNEKAMSMLRTGLPAFEKMPMMLLAFGKQSLWAGSRAGVAWGRCVDRTDWPSMERKQNERRKCSPRPISLPRGTHLFLL